MSNDSVAQVSIAALQICDFRESGFKVSGSGSSRRSKSVVLPEHVSIEEMNFLDGSLRDEIEDVRTSAAEADNGYPVEFELLRRSTNAGAARSCIHVVEYRIFSVRVRPND